MNSLPHVISDVARLANPELLGDASLGPLAATLLITSLVYLVSVRAMRQPFWLYPAVILGSLGILILVESTLRLPGGLFVLTTVLLMNLLVGIAHLIQRNQRRVELLLGIAEGSERPFCYWPAVVTAAVVLGQGIFFCLAVLRLASPQEPNWPWLVMPVLACGLFLHLFYLERHRYYVHVLIASSLLGCLGAAASSSWMVAPDLAVATLGLLWGLVAAGLASPRGDGVLRAIGPRMETDERSTVSQATVGWSAGLLAFSLAVTVPTWTQIEPGFPSTGITLLLVAFGCAVGGYQWRRAELESVAAVLLPAGICATLAFFRSSRAPLEMLPIAGLVTIVLSPAYAAISGRLTAPLDGRRCGCFQRFDRTILVLGLAGLHGTRGSRNAALRDVTSSVSASGADSRDHRCMLALHGVELQARVAFLFGGGGSVRHVLLCSPSNLRSADRTGPGEVVQRHRPQLPHCLG